MARSGRKLQVYCSGRFSAELSGLGSMNQTTITDINIPFGRMVAIIIKWMLASIPAIIIMYAIMAAVMLVMMLVFGGIIGGSGILDNLDSLTTPPAIEYTEPR